jgi:hypothetical protein
LDDHLASLKEMVALPLMYPEVFARFALEPPKGVLFWGPPGTGKTLVARALASSCFNGSQPVAFFMRKGADILSKWVGEAEKQLRVLFDEARRQQPAVIFFDEIDGLAPVRSSKQDQIHASIVSTLLALMDGLDSRGQVSLGDIGSLGGMSTAGGGVSLCTPTNAPPHLPPNHARPDTTSTTPNPHFPVASRGCSSPPPFSGHRSGRHEPP